jgi:RHS repeat-associated protein
MSNHLGNVLTTLTYKTIPVETTGDGLIDSYIANIISANDYYSFGMAMPGRSYSNGSDYRYGFNGKEKDKSINSGALDYGERVYDGRIGKWLSVDPLQKKYSDVTPYNYCLNNPILFIDPDGKIVKIYDNETRKLIAIVKANHEIVMQKGYTKRNAAIKAYEEAYIYLKDQAKSSSLSELEGNEKVLNLRVTSKIIGEVVVVKGKLKQSLSGSEFKANTDGLVFGDYNDEDGNGQIGKSERKSLISAVFEDNEIGTILWNPRHGSIDKSGAGQSPALTLEHEVQHAKEFTEHALRYLQEGVIPDENMGDKHEKRVVDKINEISKNLKSNYDGGGGEMPRKTHGGGGSVKLVGSTTEVPTNESKDVEVRKKNARSQVTSLDNPSK